MECATQSAILSAMTDPIYWGCHLCHNTGMLGYEPQKAGFFFGKKRHLGGYTLGSS